VSDGETFTCSVCGRVGTPSQKPGGTRCTRCYAVVVRFPEVYEWMLAVRDHAIATVAALMRDSPAADAKPKPMRPRAGPRK
jgi:hypothetical protein